VSAALWAVLPGGIDDPAAPSGGNRYDRVVLTLLSGAEPARSGAEPARTPPPPRHWVGTSGAGGYDDFRSSST
jgi:hypothetical protein